MPKMIVVTLKMTLVLGVLILMVMGILGVLEVYSSDELVEMLKTAFLILGIIAAGSIAIAGLTGDWRGQQEEKE